MSDAVAPAPPRQSPNVTVAVLASAAITYAFAQTMVAPALPEIGRNFDASPTASSWALTAFLITGSVMTPILGRFGDMFGKRRMLLWVLVIFACGSVIGGLSHSLELLIVGRAIQGTAGAIFPLAFGIVRDEFPPDRSAHGLGIISGTFGIGGGLGLCIAGPVVDHLSYEWVFWLPLIVSAISFVLVWRFIPDSPVRSASARIDWTGAALMAVGVTALLVAISEGREWDWLSPAVIGLFFGAGAILAFWVWFERRVEVPLVDMRMMARKGIWTVNLTAMFLGFGMFASFIIIPQFVTTPEGAGYGFAASITESALYLLPSTAMMLVTGPIAGWLGQKYSPKLPLTGGSVFIALSFFWMGFLHDEPWQIVTGSFIMGLGLGAAFAAMPALIVRSVDPTQTGVATGMNIIVRNIGGAIGTQVSAVIITSFLLTSGLPKEEGYTWAFFICGVMTVIAVLISLLCPDGDRVAAANGKGNGRVRDALARLDAPDRAQAELVESVED